MPELLEREVDVRFFQARSDSHRGPRRFREPAIEVSLILEGGLVFLVDGERRDIRAPCATLQAYHDDLQVQSRADMLTRTMWCRFPLGDPDATDWTLLQSTPDKLPIPALLPSLFTTALAIAQTGETLAGPGEAAKATNLIGKTILSEYLRNASTEFGRAPLPPAIARARQVLDENFAEHWTIGQLAKLTGLNGNYLIGLFKAHLGVTPIRYLWERRMEAGLDMLRTRGSSVEEIAFLSGFQSAAHFSRRMKERNGISPIGLRRRS